MTILRIAAYSFVCTVALFAAESPLPPHRVIPIQVPAGGKTGFSLLGEAMTGIRFTNALSPQAVAENQIRLNGSGVALGDVDGDGLCDIYLCRLEGPNALWRNLGGWKFADITAQSGTACAGQYSNGAALADVDGDEDLDLLVTSIGGGTRCFFNDGKGRFAENNSGLLRKYCATSMALADIDGNGTLDLYVANYRTTTIRSTGLQVLNVNGRRALRPEDRDAYELTPEGMILEHAEPDQLYLNNGKGYFSPVSWTDGRFLDANEKPLTRPDKDWGLSVMFRDMNNDGAPDIYVCNDFWSADAIWINDGTGKFRPLPSMALRISSTFSMGVDFADINRDGHDDIFVVDMRSREHARRMRQRSMIGGGAMQMVSRIDERPQIERNTLFLSRGDGTYAEMAQFAGIHASEWSWCPVFIDVDLDGYEDVLIPTGHLYDSQDSDVEMRLARAPKKKLGENILEYPSLAVPKQAFRNRGDMTFETAGDAWGFNQSEIGHGIATADLDGDGDLDVIVNNLNSAASIYRNDSSAARIAIRLKGKAPNTRGVGARIRVTGGPMNQSQEMISGGRYLSCDDAMRVFAAGSPASSLTVEVKWRNGNVTIVSNVPANRLVEVDEKHFALTQPTESPTPPPLFVNKSDSLAHVHHDEPFDDFARQPLLTKRLSHFGPGIAWADVDGDGHDDLLIPSGKGGRLTVFRNGVASAFKAMRMPDALASAEHDQTTVLALPDGEGGTAFFVGMANYESGDSTTPAVRRFSAWAGGVDAQEHLPAQTASAGAVATADVDGDGELDLFVGGQVNPGRYPEPATSRLYLRKAGKYQLHQELTSVGLVNAAVFSDLDGDSRPELILSKEWAAPAVLRYREGRYHEADFGLSRFRGWWTGVTTGDFDGDGRMDIAAGNWGRNSPWQSNIGAGVNIYYADFSGAGRMDGVESYFESGPELPWRDLDTLARVIPSLRGSFASYAAFGAARLDEVLGPMLKTAKKLEAVWLESTVFMNRGDRWEARALPFGAQVAPAFGLAAADFDGDGFTDLFLAQNFFPTDAETSRYDAGRGLLLKGNGRGDFTEMTAAQSGVEIYGDQRGAAVCDYDGDGRVDLAVGQNSGPTVLLHNERAAPGVRVRLRGTAQNPAAIGAQLRRGEGSTLGPAHEIRAGSGWWSQDSAAVVLAGPGSIVQVRWPGGGRTTTTIPANATSITIDTTGKAKISGRP